MERKRALVWLRRDLRLKDHSPLSYASAYDLAVVFIFDKNILGSLPPEDRRLTFLHQSLQELDSRLKEKGSSLIVRIGDPRREIAALAQKLGVSIVVAGRDYEPYAKSRDKAVGQALNEQGIEFKSLKDQVIFEGSELQTKSGGAFKVFTPYKNCWLSRLSPAEWEERKPLALRFIPPSETEKLSTSWDLAKIGFKPMKLWLEPGEKAGRLRLKSFGKKLSSYGKDRDFPAIEGSSGLSAHLRFGTVSVRECVRLALADNSSGAKVWLSELIWRDFYQMILDNFPHVVKHAFRPAYDSISWPGSEAHFRAWCEGKTGYPIVDAAMREFNATGWMHNRLRMIVASFLTKDLLVDWRKGEAYFAKGLLDFDLASNNGGWQWSASTGCDSQPYFRIFNPYAQSEKFDPKGDFIRKNIPELSGVLGKEIHQPKSADYPQPIVDHKLQRAKALALFKKA